MFRKLIYLIAFLLLPMWAFPQSSNWNSTIDLGITVDDDDIIDLYVDKDGAHLIVQESNALKYYLFSVEDGSQIRTSTRDNNVNESPRLNRLVGSGDDLYIIFKEDSKIKSQRSTNAGSSWTAIDEITLSSSTSNGLDAWPASNGVHLVYSEASGSDYESTYSFYNETAEDWEDSKEVTDLSGEVGGYPSVTVSSSRVHVQYTTGGTAPFSSEETSTRERISGTWQSSSSALNSSGSIGLLIASGSKLHGFYYDILALTHELRYKNRDLTSTTWSGSSTLLEYDAIDAEDFVDLAVSDNDKVHFVVTNLNPNLYYNEWNSGWGTHYAIDTGGTIKSQRISANSDDIYVGWIADDGGSYTVKLAQRDFDPLAPEGLVRSIAEPSTDKHPRVDWDDNAEADVDTFRVYKKIGTGSWNFLASTTNTCYIDESETGVDLNHVANEVELKYKLKARDFEQNDSDFSGEVTFYEEGGSPSKVSSDPVAHSAQVPEGFILKQNYPNPFNPTTSIEFQLPQDQPAKLTIYALNGQEITTLVNAELAKGIHRVEWNGHDASGNLVSSGMYIYRLSTPSVTLSRKMMFLK